MADGLLQALADLRAENEKIRDEKADLETRIQDLERIIRALRRQIFGRRSERFRHDPHQLLLIEELAEEARHELENELRQRARKFPTKGPSKKNGRKPLSKNLKRKHVVLDLPEEQKTCPHGYRREKFGEDRTEELEVIPAQFFVVQYVRPKYKTPGCPCPQCHGITMASLPPRPIEKGRAGPGLLAHVVVSKYGEHLPLYRQSQIFERQGVELSRSTLCDWVQRAGELLRPIAQAMKRDLLGRRYLQADETPIRVLGVEKGTTQRGYLWGYGIPWAEVVYDFSLTREQRHPEAFLEGFRGHLQIDGYDGYNAVFHTGEVKRLGCFAHVRRKFYAALKESPEQAKTVLAALQLLYRLEREMKRDGLAPQDKVARRQEHARPILEDLESLLHAYRPEVLPESSLGQAIRYALNEWPFLQRYIDVGEAEIDNNGIEHTLRPVALGRKNYLFCGSPGGGENAATLYSLVTTCKRLRINSWEYLRDVIDRLSTHPMSRIDELTPRGWKEIRDRMPTAVSDPAPAS